MILKGTKDDDLTLKYLLEKNKGSGGGGSGDVPEPAEANPLMDSVAFVGISDKYAREDHIHPHDTSRASQTDMTNVQGDISAIDAKIGTTALPTTAQTLTGAIDEIYNDHSSDGVIYLTNVPCSAMTGDFASVSNQYITSSHYVAECVFANPSYITSNVSWTTASGSLKLNGTCSAATTCNIVLVGPSNWTVEPPSLVLLSVDGPSTNVAANGTYSVTKNFSIPSGYTPLGIISRYTSKGAILASSYLSNITASSATVNYYVVNPYSSALSGDVATVNVILTRGLT